VAGARLEVDEAARPRTAPACSRMTGRPTGRPLSCPGADSWRWPLPGWVGLHPAACVTGQRAAPAGCRAEPGARVCCPAPRTFPAVPPLRHRAASPPSWPPAGLPGTRAGPRRCHIVVVLTTTMSHRRGCARHITGTHEAGAPAEGNSGRSVRAGLAHAAWPQLVPVPGVKPAVGPVDVGYRAHGLAPSFGWSPRNTVPFRKPGVEGYFLGAHKPLSCASAQVTTD